jgi:hypothetical protein
MKVSLYLDEDAQDNDLIHALRLHNVDVVKAWDVGMREREDEEHLLFATAQGRVLYGFNARKKLDGLPLGDDGFNQVFIELAFGQQFHVCLWSQRPSVIGQSPKRPQEIGSIDRPFQIHTEVKHIDQINHCGLAQPRTDAVGDL